MCKGIGFVDSKTAEPNIDGVPCYTCFGAGNYEVDTKLVVYAVPEMLSYLRKNGLAGFNNEKTDQYTVKITMVFDERSKE